MIEEADYVVVGAGSAGCVLANRLSEDGRNSVALLEYGGSDRSIYVRMPSALSIPMHMDRFNWGYVSEPEPHLGGRRMHCPRGKGLGGSSSINGMVYVRGNPADFDRWRDEGAAGWSYAEVLPYFRRAETRAEGGTAWRGDGGPLRTRYGNTRNPLYRAFLAAAKQAGYPETDDSNGFQQEGFGRLDMTVHRGERWSAARAYLDPAAGRRNLAVLSQVLATRILFEGRRAVGVEYASQQTQRSIRARREIIVAAGAIGSPQLLKTSGVGPADELRTHGVTVVQDRTSVGENLQDHLEFYFQVACTQPITLYSATRPWAKPFIGLRWLASRSGLGATNHFEVGGFIRSRAGVRIPDLQFHFLPLAVSYDGSGLARGHGFQAHVGPMRSQARGSVRLASADMRDKPKIRFNYMSHPGDWAEMRAAVRLTREIFAAAAFDPFRGEELQPGASVQSDDAIDGFIRDHAESAFHPSCTCRMGRRNDPTAVVDPETRVIGVDRLRVADASIMPSITTGNLNAPTIMIAEKASDMILGRPPLPAADAGYHVPQDWQERQR
jgi:choline dehydrogenase